MRLYEDILDDLEAREKSASKVVSDNIETEGYSSMNEWYEDVEQNYTHIFRLTNLYILGDKENTINDVVYQLESIADHYFPNHSDVLIRTDSEEDWRNIQRKNFLWTGKILNNKPLYNFSIAIDCREKKSVTRFLNFWASIYSIIQPFWDPNSDCCIYIETIVNGKLDDIERLGTDAYDYKFRFRVHRAEDFEYTVRAIIRYGFSDDKDTVWNEFSAWLKKIRENRSQQKNRYIENISSLLDENERVEMMNYDLLDDIEAKSSVDVEKLIDKEELSLEDWEANAKQNYTHIITTYDNAYEGVDADKMIEDDVYRLNAIFDRYFPNHSDVFVSCVSENAMGLTTRDDVYFEDMPWAGSDTMFIFRIAFDDYVNNRVFKILDAASLIFSLKLKGFCTIEKIGKGEGDKGLTGFLPFDETYNHRFLGEPIDRSDITKRMLKAIKSFELGTGNPRVDKKEF